MNNNGQPGEPGEPGQPVEPGEPGQGVPDNTTQTRLKILKIENIVEGYFLSRRGKISLGIYFIVSAIILAYLIYEFWPTVSSPVNPMEITPEQSEIFESAVISDNLSYSSDNTTMIVPVNILSIRWDTTAELKLILLILVIGMTGRYIHNIVSFIKFTGNRRLIKSWLWQYILSPFVAAFLALFFYFILRGGMLAANTGQTDLNVYGVLAISGLVGLFSEKALAKLNDIANTFFNRTNEDQDADPLNNPKPQLKAVAFVVGNKKMLSLAGEGFSQNSIVYFDDIEINHVFISAQEIQANILPSFVADQKIEIKVSNPSPGGGESVLLWVYKP